MKKFKAFISEEPQPPPALFVQVKNGRAQLCDVNQLGSACATFGFNIATAQISGNQVVTVTKDGVTQTWRIEPVARQVIGPFKH